MLRKGLLAGALLILLPAVLGAYTIVLKGGRHLEAKSRYVIEAGQVKFTGTDGRAYQFPLAQLDLVATAQANRAQQPKMWTNEDLERLRGAPVNVLGTAGAGGAAGSAGGEGQAAGGGAPGGEGSSQPPKEDTAEYWQEKLQPLRTELAQVEQEIQQLRSARGQKTSGAISLAAPAQGTNVEDRLRQLESRRTELQRQIEDVQFEAKRKGIAPGKVR